jgi:drug/metabolite transporter (DMT)-like permease
MPYFCGSQNMKQALIRLNIAVFLWGFTGVLGRLISLNAGWLVWWRLLFVAVGAWLFFGLQKKIQLLPKPKLVAVMLLGALLGLHWLCFYGSIKLSNVSIALTCMATTGLFSAIIEPLFFRRKLQWNELALGLLVLMGVLLIYYSNLHFSLGVLVGVIAAILTVIVSVVNKKFVHDVEPVSFTVFQLTGSFLGLSILMPLYHYLFPTTHIVPQQWDWLWIFTLAIGCTILPFVLYVQALRKVSAFTINLTLTLEPVYGIVLAFAVYQENKELSTGFYYGLILIIVAVALQMKTLMKSTMQVPAVDAERVD